jgi:hypothetical protein
MRGAALLLRAGLAAGAGAGLGGSCSTANPGPPPPTASALQDPRVVRRMEGLRAVSTSRDTSHVPQVIELLDDGDEGVRFLAGAVLADLTGRHTGYRADAGPAERREQVLQWRAWWASRGGAVPSAAVTSVPPPPPPAPLGGPAPPTGGSS